MSKIGGEINLTVGSLPTAPPLIMSVNNDSNFGRSYRLATPLTVSVPRVLLGSTMALRKFLKKEEITETT